MKFLSAIAEERVIQNISTKCDG